MSLTGANGQMKRSPIVGTFTPQCKLCKMTKSHPELSEMINQWRFGDGASYRDIAEKANRMIDRDQLGIPHLVISNFVQHWSSHISPDAVLIHEMQEKASTKPKKPADPEILSKAVEVKRQSLEKIEKNLLAWQRTFDSIYTSLGLDNVDPDGNAAPPTTVPTKDDVDAMSKAHATWADLIKTKELLLKERIFTIEVMQQAVDLYGRSFANSVSDRLIAIRDEHKANNPQFADDVDLLFEDFVKAIKESIVGNYDATIKEIADKFSL